MITTLPAPGSSDCTHHLIGVLYGVLSKVAAEGQSDDAVPVAALAGQLYLSQSGWLLLRVPNAFGRGVYEQLSVMGAELPENYNAHISVMTPEEVQKIGRDAIVERGRTYRYQLGPLCTVAPAGQSDTFSRVWFVRVASPELSRLRQTYGLSPLPNDQPFHITIAYRRHRVLGHNHVAKRT